MERKHKLKIAYILWTINFVSLMCCTYMLNPEWLKTLLSLVWLVTLPIAITFSILGHKKTKEEKLIKKNDRKIRRNHQKYSFTMKMLRVYIVSFVVISTMVPLIVGSAIKSKTLLGVGIGIQILFAILLLLYFVLKKKEERRIAPIVMAAVDLLILVMFILYVFGVQFMSCPLIVLILLTVIIMTWFGATIEGSWDITTLMHWPFEFSEGGTMMCVLVSILIIAPAIFLMVDIIEKGPDSKVIRVSVDENGNKEIIEEQKDK